MIKTVNFAGIGAGIAALMLLGSVQVHAGAAGDYVKGLQGKWRGGGTVTVNSKGKKVKLRCSTTNTLDKNSRTLTMKGRCATSENTRPLRGTIKYSADGRKITSASFRLAGRGSGANASLRGNTLTLTGTATEEGSGRKLKGRTTVTGGGRKYNVSLQSQDGGKWKSNGTLSFRR